MHRIQFALAHYQYMYLTLTHDTLTTTWTARLHLVTSPPSPQHQTSTHLPGQKPLIHLLPDHVALPAQRAVMQAALVAAAHAGALTGTQTLTATEVGLWHHLHSALLHQTRVIQMTQSVEQ